MANGLFGRHMLKQHSQLMLTLMVLADAAAIACAWLLSYWIRFTFLPAEKGVPDLVQSFLPLLPLVVVAHLVIFARVRLYRPRRSSGLFAETRDILKAFATAVVCVVLIDYAMPASSKISRQFLLTYAVVGAMLFGVFRLLVRGGLRTFRRHGWNRRRAAIVGSGRAAQRLLRVLRRNAWTGFDVAYLVDDPPRRRRESSSASGGAASHSATTAGRPESPAPPDGAAGSEGGDQASHPPFETVSGLPVRGPLSDLRAIVESDPVDAIFVALPRRSVHRTSEVLESLSTCMADLRLVPEVSGAYHMRPDVSELDGVPILSLRQSPLWGWNAVAKRGFDLVVGSICLMLAAIPMLVIAALIRLSSPGPALYRQRRMGMDGVEFEMLKFRTMRQDAEAGGAVWSRKADNRRTAIGSFLRRTSLDELPNLFNVLRGEMSLVGPRPERPEFVRQFRGDIEHYMLRHKIKAGMTGFAQVRGLRGDTSLRKRIRHDLHYIRNWSLWLDVRIFFRTLFGVWFSRHES
ncbi:MAG: undecaprenyl-phosphate glucose phosphotransferase [Phycisphaerales bacterium]|nr:undecaprenyl-phosphate glucose phosphotransferase [Phycisphaerales bacterium]